MTERYQSGRAGPAVEPMPGNMAGLGRWRVARLLLALLLPGTALSAQQLDGARLTNAGVVRANAQVDSVFIRRLAPTVTIDVGDFTAYLLARVGAPPFPDSTGFRVTTDSQVVRISGRLRDFPPEKVQELGPFLLLLDSTSLFVAELRMPQRDSGVIRLRLERILVNGLAIPEVLLGPAIAAYGINYEELSNGGREFLVAMPVRGEARLLDGQIRLHLPAEAPPPRDSLPTQTPPVQPDQDAVQRDGHRRDGAPGAEGLENDEFGVLQAQREEDGRVDQGHQREGDPA